jgi:DNA polymerase V
MSTYLLVDCNQFFVSCEQLFNPKLLGKPVVVLSSNDGCVVSRSKEAKALGIPMGAPAYQFSDLFKRHKVHAFSSNFPLYSDMSRRVMQLLHTFSSDVEEYSVDEAFLIAPPDEAPKIREKVLKWTGIPVSIGIGKTKTLAKVAGDLAKKTPDGVLHLADDQTIDHHLSQIPPSEIWGVGSRLNAGLKEAGIFTALQLKNASEIWIQKRFSVMLLRTLLELKGTPCLSLEEIPEVRKSLTCSRSFGLRITELSLLEEAVSSYIASAAEKLRDEGLAASYLTVFITTSPFLKPPDYYSNATTLSFPEPTNYTPFLITAAKEALRTIFRPGFQYKKAGVIFNEISCANLHQCDLFSSDEIERQKRKKVMALVDGINSSFDRPLLHFAAQGTTKSWKPQRDNSSPHYTTRWDQLLTIEI